MARFNVASLNPKLRKQSTQDYGSILSVLSIEENLLAEDGKMTPGDWKKLAKKAERYYPSLSPKNRLNLQAKVSGYKSKASQTSRRDSEDIQRLNRETKNDIVGVTAEFGNNPEIWLQGKGEVLRQKLERISESIGNLEQSGNDASLQWGEYKKTLGQWQDSLDAVEAIKSYKDGTEPQSGFISMVTTNDKGEITDFKVGREGDKSGYIETQGVYGGLQMYVDKSSIRKTNGRNSVNIGGIEFSGADLIKPDPLNPGAFTNTPLVASSKIKKLGGGRVNIAEGGFVDVNLNDVRQQLTIPDGKYGIGTGGTIYKNEGGSYVKIIGKSLEDLGVKKSDTMNLYSSVEDSIIPQVKETRDLSPKMEDPLPFDTSAATPSEPAMFGPPAPDRSTLGKGRSRTPSPVDRSPQSSQGIAQKALGAAKGFLSGLFNK